MFEPSLIPFAGIPFAASMVFPFAVVGKYFSTSGERGLYMATLNVFIVVPQLLDTAYTGVLTRQWSESVVLLVGGGWALLAALSTWAGLDLADDAGAATDLAGGWVKGSRGEGEGGVACGHGGCLCVFVWLYDRVPCGWCGVLLMLELPRPLPKPACP